MFAYFRGELVVSSREEAVVDVVGVGYLLSISDSTFRRLPALGSEVTLLAHLQVKEDLMQLYGFIDEEERQLFRLLLSITGVGPKLALAILSGLPVQEIQEAIMANVPEKLFGITGVGRKTAGRIILELRDRILKLHEKGAKGKTAVSMPALDVSEDALQALLTLGFSKSSAEEAVSAALQGMDRPSVEEVVRIALQHIRNH
ncbi:MULTISPECIES: Holliday junction branch migration protein RuvA [Prosthecochloris]|uniref:Holliday junction branch migration complex subunit RuvA n=1 Tax=Prosthecochloris vibrioformis TaxID=1098 RepID=A0A5C4S069_PROVB|nr:MULTISPECIES: Holliday junction branch migration protein RuvA [Prosthecochloris]ANT64207.1 Holliday junction ATP-dependent DNA helicase RuvA [Prosthecochloris sp. CIB 2401]TNJ36635.1 Holliday junction branch migration protein RuvA [Prosthecochloris vibrioformis]